MNKISNITSVAGLMLLILANILESSSLRVQNISVTVLDSYKTWQGAMSGGDCVLAGRSMTRQLGTEDVRFVVQDTGDSNPSTVSTIAWVGAGVHYSDWFSFGGCYYGSVKNTHHMYSRPISSDPILHCQENCPLDFVLVGDYCVCKEDVMLNTTGCLPSKCRDNSDFLCGYTSGEIALDVCMCEYQSLKDTDFHDNPLNVDNSDCMSVAYPTANNNQPAMPVFQSENCSAELPYICRSMDKTSTTQHYHMYDAFAWSRAAEKCYENNYQFSGFDVRDSPYYRQSVYWVALFRRPIIVWNNASLEPGTKCVAAIVLENGVLQIRLLPCNTPLPAFCEVVKDFQPEESSMESILLILFVITVSFVLLSVLIICWCQKRKQDNNAQITRSCLAFRSGQKSGQTSTKDPWSLEVEKSEKCPTKSLWRGDNDQTGNSTSSNSPTLHDTTGDYDNIDTITPYRRYVV